MKKLLIIVLALLMVGITMADTGIPKVNEVQGLRTTTTVIAAGNFNGESSIDLSISTENPLTDLVNPEREFLDAVVYQTIYTEDTQNSEVGYISYDKDLDLQTGNKVSGQYNIKAVKQITYLGVDASSVVTNDYLMLDGAAEPDGDFEDWIICPFAGDASIQDFCNKVETGSAMNLKVANLNTQLGDRFIMKSADPGVEIFNNVGVSSYATDLPSKGSVSAYIKGSIKEGGRNQEPFDEDEHDLYETITFSDSTAISGDISTFSKSMLYTSILDAAGDEEEE